MSKKGFVGLFSDQDPVRAFSPEFLNARSLPGRTFEMSWPLFQPGPYSAQLDQQEKETEAKILKKAREKALFIEKEAYEKGFAQGEKDGLELGEKRLEAALRQVQALLTAIGEERKSLYRAYEKEMVQLVLSISRKILHNELQTREEVIALTLREAFHQVVDRKKVAVHLNPIDYQHLLGCQEKLPFAPEDRNGVTMLEDPSITRGGCFMETTFGDVDATIEGQFDGIASLVWERLQRCGLLEEKSAG